MPTKADKSDLNDLEKRFKEIIDDIVRQMLELMPSKDDIQNKFAAINKKMKEMHDLLSMSRTKVNLTEDDAMLTKK